MCAAGGNSTRWPSSVVPTTTSYRRALPRPTMSRGSKHHRCAPAYYWAGRPQQHAQEHPVGAAELLRVRLPLQQQERQPVPKAKLLLAQSRRPGWRRKSCNGLKQTPWRLQKSWRGLKLPERPQMQWCSPCTASELEHAYGEVMASDADAEREEALAEEHFRTLIGRVLDAILDVAIEEVAAVEAVALATQAAAAEAAALAEEAVLAEEHWLRTRYLEEPRLLLTFDAEDASVVCEAATAQPPRGTSAGRTLLHDVLGSVNVRRIRFTEDPSVGVDRRKKREQRVLKNGVLIGERRFQVFAYKEDDEGTYVFIAEHGRSWHPFLGVVTWRSVSEARQLFANFESVPSLPKYTMRPGLLLSKTFDLRTVLEERLAIRRVVVHSHPVETLPLPVQLSAPPPGTLQVIELADVRSGAGHLMTDGGGMVSADVADQIPLITRRSHCPLSEARDSPRSGPMVTQMRLWYHGAVAKGTLLRDATLPERTVVLRRSMIKVEARGSEHFWAFEVVATSKAAREARTSKLLVSLLESIGGEAMGRALMSLAHAHLTKLLECTKPPLPLHMLSKLAEHDLNDIEHSEADGDLEPVTSTLGILNAGFEPMREPYLHQKLSQIVASQLKKVREGSFPIPQSVFAFGVPDPTGTLEPGTCCLVTEGVFYMDQPSALLYRHPGLHPGSVRRVRVVSPPSALRRALEGVDPLRATAIIFSTRGERSLADEMDGGDMSATWSLRSSGTRRCSRRSRGRAYPPGAKPSSRCSLVASNGAHS